MVEHGSELVKAVVVLAAGVIAVPIFKRLGLGSVLGYLAAGLAVGPFGLGFFDQAQTVLNLAEFGVVMFLFVIGLEMQPSRLWNLRKQIFGIGLLQVMTCALLITSAAVLAGFVPSVGFIAAMGFVLSSTAIVMQMLDERGITSTARGQRIVSILLLEDLTIVPLLAIVAALSPEPQNAGISRGLAVGIAIAALLGLVAVSRYLLNPFFRLLSKAKAREVMTAAALLVVLGASLAMQWGGLSMALGAFAAGVMLSESTFRHQLEADIEPFRGILLGLFFIGVGMSLDVTLVLEHWRMLLALVLAAMTLKSTGVYLVARLTKSPHAVALERAAMMTQGGEFAFVLYSAAATAGVIEAPVHAALTAAVIVSMALTPLAVMALRWALPKSTGPDMRGVDPILGAGRDGEEQASDRVLIIGFGRFGQIASQMMLARGVDVTIIDNDTDMIRTATRFGFHAWYGDGTRMDVLHASGAEHARALLVCVDNKEVATRIVQAAKKFFPLLPVLARAYDRQHAIALIKSGVDYQVRETFASAMVFGAEALRRLDVPEEEIAQVADDVRRRDAQRLELQLAGGIQQGLELLRGNRWAAEPLTKPQREGQQLNEDAPAESPSAFASPGRR